MIRPTPKIPDGARVRLKDDVNTQMYGEFSRSGNEGWIRKHKEDKYGYQHVWIQWDPDHWAYNGAPNGWTWEDHFEIVEKSMSDRKDPLEKEIAGIASAFAQE